MWQVEELTKMCVYTPLKGRVLKTYQPCMVSMVSWTAKQDESLSAAPLWGLLPGKVAAEMWGGGGQRDHREMKSFLASQTCLRQNSALEWGKFICLFLGLVMQRTKSESESLLLFPVSSETFGTEILIPIQIPQACAVPSLHESSSLGCLVALWGLPSCVLFVPFLPGDTGTCKVRCG